MQFISLTSTGPHHIPLVQSYLVIGLKIGKPCGCSLKFAWDKRSTDLTSNPFFFTQSLMEVFGLNPVLCPQPIDLSGGSIGQWC